MTTTTEPEAQPASNLSSFLRVTLPSLAVAGTVGTLEALRRRFQRRQIFRPSRYPTGIWNPAIYGLPYEDVWFESEDGTRLHGWWIEHPRAAATVVFCHGNTGSIGDRIGLYRQLRRLKVDILAFDYRGYGRSHGRPSEKGLFSDVRAACDFVVGRGIALDRTVLFGHSLGGAVAVDGALHRPVAGLVVQASFTQLSDMARHVYRGLPIHLIARNQFRSIDKVDRLEMPKLFIHGTEDGTVPFSIGEALFAAASEPKEWYPVPRAGHNDVDRWGGRQYLRTVKNFFRRCAEPRG
ncbi:MAG: alpha/beta hydrolase [Thermoanaerobaculia bacterium]